MEKDLKFTVRTQEITAQEIDDLMATALEGGINHWCCYAEVIDKPEGECKKVIFRSDVISRNGTLKLYDTDSDDTWILTREKFLKGVDRALDHFFCDWTKCPIYSNVQDMVENHDGDVADVIIQYALFDEIVFV